MLAIGGGWLCEELEGEKSRGGGWKERGRTEEREMVLRTLLEDCQFCFNSQILVPFNLGIRKGNIVAHGLQKSKVTHSFIHSPICQLLISLA